MGNCQWKSSVGGTWADVLTAALAGTYAGGGPVVVRPEATDRDGLGLPCGAVGTLAKIVIKASQITGTGMAHWMGRFGSTSANYVATWQTAYDPRAGTWGGWTGYLIRPVLGAGYQSVSIGSDAAHTMYRGVEITIENAVAATWP
jgi:hypothetical protein